MAEEDKQVLNTRLEEKGWWNQLSFNILGRHINSIKQCKSRSNKSKDRK